VPTSQNWFYGPSDKQISYVTLAECTCSWTWVSSHHRWSAWSCSPKTLETRWRQRNGCRSLLRTWSIHAEDDWRCDWQWSSVLTGTRTLLPTPGRGFHLSACLSTSQAYVERVFSFCGDLCCRKRNRVKKCLERRDSWKWTENVYLHSCGLICGPVPVWTQLVIIGAFDFLTVCGFIVAAGHDCLFRSFQ